MFFLSFIRYLSTIQLYYTGDYNKMNYLPVTSDKQRKRAYNDL